MHASYETDVCRLTHNMCPLVGGPPFARKMMFFLFQKEMFLFCFFFPYKHLDLFFISSEKNHLSKKNLPNVLKLKYYMELISSDIT